MRLDDSQSPGNMWLHPEFTLCCAICQLRPVCGSSVSEIGVRNAGGCGFLNTFAVGVMVMLWERVVLRTEIATRMAKSWQGWCGAASLPASVKVVGAVFALVTMASPLQQCNYTLGSNVFRKTLEHELEVRHWKPFKTESKSLSLDWNFSKWQSTKAINTALGDLDDHCIGVAVRWRFEESRCKDHQIGLCFSRCNDCSVVSGGFHPVAKEWIHTSECIEDGHFRGVGLSKTDLIVTIEERAAQYDLSKLYLATDGWMRGAEGLALLHEVVPFLRGRGLNVVGWWSIPGLPNFSDGTYYGPYFTMGKQHVINGQQIALVEQEICVPSAVFLGSRQSTWSLSVFRFRFANRRLQEILGSVPDADNLDPKARDELIRETLLKDDHATGLQWPFSRFRTRATVNGTAKAYADEYSDGWLDLDACDHCQLAKCF